MTPFPHSRNARLRLLASIPALLLVLPASAYAQSTTLTVEGRTIATNDQRGNGANVQGVIINPPASVSVTSLTDSEARITGNTVSANARQNDASTEIDAEFLTGGGWPVRVAIAGDGISAEGAALDVSRQSLRTSSAFAEALTSGYSLYVGSAAGSQVELGDNAQRATARGNDHLATLADEAGMGIATITLQRGDTGSAVRSAIGGLTSLTAIDAAQSALHLDRNQQLAVASGNGAALTLKVSKPSQIAGNGDATRVDTGHDAEVSAGSVTVAHQIWSGPASARIGSITAPAGYLTTVRSLGGSTSTADANSLTAAAVGNQAVAEHRSLASLADGSGTVATNLTVQDVEGAVTANITGGARAYALGLVDRSTISASANNVRASATGNASDSLLTGSGAVRSGNSETPSRTGGLVWVDSDQVTGTSGNYTVHTEQHAGDTGIAATLAQSAVAIGLDELVDGSRVAANGSHQSAEAVANDAQSVLDLAATTAGSAALSLVQSSDADIGSFVGSADDFAGATIAPAHRLQESRLLIQDNLLEARSVANRGTNTLTFSAASIASNPFDAFVGTVDGGFNASADAVLGSAQKTGQLGAAPRIASEAVGRFSVTGDGATVGTAIVITGNRQMASATANGVDNRLSVDVAGDGSAALASSQYGEATLSAISTMRAVSRGGLEDSTTRVAGNVNQAVTTMNDASNLLEASAAGTGFGHTATLTADPLGGATGEGNSVLVNTQFATGNIVSSARTMLGGSPGDTSLGTTGPVGSRIDLSGNVTAAQASGNQALNEADLVTGGIASSQMNVASVSAAAKVIIGFHVPLPGRSVVASELSVADNTTSALARGNMAENRMTLTGGAMNVPVSSNTDRFETRAEAPAALVSVQTNYGPVGAVAEGSVAAIPLNLEGVPVDASRIGISGNAMSATAYGNGAANTIRPVTGSIALVNAQTNYGPVMARVNGAGIGLDSGEVIRSTLAITNNSISAAATGNLATNIIAGPR